MHAAFLYHAIRAGLDMAIVNAGQLDVYEEIPPDLLEHVEDVLLDRRPDATERLIELRRDPSRAQGRRQRPRRPGARDRSSSGSATPWSRGSSISSTKTSKRPGGHIPQAWRSSKGR